MAIVPWACGMGSQGGESHHRTSWGCGTNPPSQLPSWDTPPWPKACPPGPPPKLLNQVSSVSQWHHRVPSLYPIHLERTLWYPKYRVSSLGLDNRIIWPENLSIYFFAVTENSLQFTIWIMYLTPAHLFAITVEKYPRNPVSLAIAVYEHYWSY